MADISMARRIQEGVLRRYKRVRRKMVRLTEAQILEALQSFGKFDADLLFVHSSLSNCGVIEGGPATVINALRSWISDRPALALPTHTWSYPDENGVAPIYDYESTPSVVGAITNYYWRLPNIVRSKHPTHSIACSGPDAEKLCAGHEFLDTPCGAATPYEQIANGNSGVLMFGATMDRYTLYHTAEAIAEVPYLYRPQQVTLRTKLSDGSIRSIKMWQQDMGVPRCFETTVDDLIAQGLVVSRKLGLSELLFIPSARALHEATVERLRRDPLFLVDEKARADVSRRTKAA